MAKAEAYANTGNEERGVGVKYFKIKQFKNIIAPTPFLMTIEMRIHKS